MLQARGLSCIYGSHRVYADVCVDLHPGEFVVLTGSNGIGKSSFLRTLAGWQQPTSGEVVFSDEADRPRDVQDRCRLIFVPDTPDFYDELTLHEHLAFVSGVNHLVGWRSRAEQLMESLLLSNSSDDYPFVLSRGMRQKFALALALLVSPQFMLLDEPFGPLDAQARQVVWDLLRIYSDGGGSVLMSSHARPVEGSADCYISLTDEGLMDRASSTDDA